MEMEFRCPPSNIVFSTILYQFYRTETTTTRTHVYWKGVECAPEISRVVSLILPNNQPLDTILVELGLIDPQIYQQQYKEITLQNFSQIYQQQYRGLTNRSTIKKKKKTLNAYSMLQNRQQQYTKRDMRN
ncbi:hypothetical protein Syun_021189 [Stephania yunnanensis]|uniref:Uncharacterized protein n=1 Tax=Stephania yunnanensis TaxID=152371 RepID=A0AAP0IH67_9MAGN